MFGTRVDSGRQHNVGIIKRAL